MSTNPYLGYASIAIANGASISGGDAIGGSPPMAVQMPAAWTAANLTFQASADGTTYADVYNTDGTEYTVTAAAARYIPLDPTIFATVAYLKIRSGTASVPVNQGGARTILVRQRWLS